MFLLRGFDLFLFEEKIQKQLLNEPDVKIGYLNNKLIMIKLQKIILIN